MKVVNFQFHSWNTALQDSVPWWVYSIRICMQQQKETEAHDVLPNSLLHTYKHVRVCVSGKLRMPTQPHQWGELACGPELSIFLPCHTQHVSHLQTSSHCHKLAAAFSGPHSDTTALSRRRGTVHPCASDNKRRAFSPRTQRLLTSHWAEIQGHAHIRFNNWQGYWIAMTGLDQLEFIAGAWIVCLSQVTWVGATHWITIKALQQEKR